MQKDKIIIIAALSARAFVADAVVAGYEVIAIDAFADVDTQNMAKQTIAVKQDYGNFDKADFLQKLAEIDCSQVAGFLYGSGFEGNVELLKLIAKQLPIIGNFPQTVAQIKTPIAFFKTLDLLKIPHPEVCFSRPQGVEGWLFKNAGSAGGMHIQNALSMVDLNGAEYFQREVAATPVSLLFLANKNSVQVIGFNLQLIDATTEYPYRYAGAISHYPLNEVITKKLIDYANRLTKHYSLVGLNSLDVLVLDNQYWVLEINPRLSASFGLYQSIETHLIDLHCQACIGNMDFTKPNNLFNITQNPKGQRIFYAPFNINIDNKIVWPDWVVDIPKPNMIIEKDDPICSVQAVGADIKEVTELLTARMQHLFKLFAAFVI